MNGLSAYEINMNMSVTSNQTTKDASMNIIFVSENGKISGYYKTVEPTKTKEIYFVDDYVCEMSEQSLKVINMSIYEYLDIDIVNQNSFLNLSDTKYSIKKTQSNENITEYIIDVSKGDFSKIFNLAELGDPDYDIHKFVIQILIDKKTGLLSFLSITTVMTQRSFSLFRPVSISMYIEMELVATNERVNLTIPQAVYTAINKHRSENNSTEVNHIFSADGAF